MPTIHALPRTALGRRVKGLRRTGAIPAVVYGRGVPSRAITVSGPDFTRVYRTAGESTLLDLEVEGVAPVKALIQEVAHHPVTGKPIHVDFHEVSMTETIHTRIPLKFTGVAPAVKEMGGIVVKHFDHVNVEALASALVHEIAVDLAPLSGMDSVIRIRDLIVPGGITLQHDADEIVVSITEAVEEEVATTTATPATVEVVGAKKEPAAEEEGAGKKPDAKKPEAKKVK
ncbi:50S ribosomal protein L25 [Candidatus Uhrbacteria bacterium]|nr:50S ribosomal protein L25 [Candidatus Uhrbacteria bacterium]